MSSAFLSVLVRIALSGVGRSRLSDGCVVYIHMPFVAPGVRVKAGCICQALVVWEPSSTGQSTVQSRDNR